MTLEKIREHLKKIRGNMEKLKKDEKKWMLQERQAEDAAKLKIIRKYNLSLEQLECLKEVSKEEIDEIMQKRKEGDKVGGQEEAKASEKD